MLSRVYSGKIPLEINSKVAEVVAIAPKYWEAIGSFVTDQLIKGSHVFAFPLNSLYITT